jgi:nitrogen fixation protein FixH
MNWGTKLVLGMLLFMGFIITLGVMMIRSESDDLVEQNYYEKGLDYDTEYAKKQRTVNDSAAPQLHMLSKELELIFKQPSSGTINFRHASDKRKDTAVNFDTEQSTEALIVLDKLDKGQWHVVIDWQSAGNEYLYESDLQLK